jgi:hypothetical protein
MNIKLAVYQPDIKSNGGGAPRYKQAGHARRRSITMVLYRTDLFPCWMRMPFILDASIGVLR